MIIARAGMVGLIAASVVFHVAAQRGGNDADRKNVQQVFEQYVESVTRADVTLAAEIWSDAADIVVVTPFGRFQGWNSVRENIYVNFLQKTFIERNLQPSDLVIHTGGDSAWLVFDWTFTGKSAAGEPITSKGWESQVYRRTRAGWRIVQLHYSVPPPPQ